MAASWQESEIIEGLFVGDLQDAQKFDGTIISVLPDVPEGEPPREYMERLYNVTRWNVFSRGGHFACVCKP